MPTNDQDARALTYLARRLRDETHGCRQWDEAGTWAKVSELTGQNLALSVERILCHATDPDAKTPGSIHRGFTPPKPSAREKSNFPVPTAAEECRQHVGQFAGSCATCKTDAIPAYSDPTPGPRVADPIKAARDAAVAAKYVPTDEESADV